MSSSVVPRGQDLGGMWWLMGVEPFRGNERSYLGHSALCLIKAEAGGIAAKANLSSGISPASSGFVGTLFTQAFSLEASSLIVLSAFGVTVITAER